MSLTARKRASWRDIVQELRGRAFWVLLGCLLCQMGLGITYVSRPLAPFVIDDLGLTRTAFSSASIPQLVMQSLASPLVGWLAVRLGASRVLAFGAALFTAVFVYFAQIENLFGLYVSIAGVGVAAASMGDVAVGHALSAWTKKSRGFALGIAYAGSNLGGLVLTQLFMDVTNRFDWRAGLLSIAGFAFFVLLPAALFLVRDAPERTDRVVAGAGEAASDPVLVEVVRSDSNSDVRDEDAALDLKQAIRTRSFWILSAALFVFFFYFQGILDHLVLFLVDSGMSRSEAVNAFSQAVGLGVISKVIGGALADRVSEERGIQIDFGLLAISSLVLLSMPDPRLVWVFVLTYGFAYPARDVVYPLVLGRCFGTRYLGEIYGAMMIALLAGSLGSIFAASIFDRLGDYHWAFLTFASLNTLAFGALFFVRDERG
jgi:sugar phosphate permease